MMRKYCLETKQDWDEGLPFLLFSAREAKQESLVFRHNVRGALKALKEQFLTDPQPRLNVHEFITWCQECLHHSCAIAQESLSAAQ